mmetsp:Transcript_5646/g.12548  ORF Transcript_5646/g.12548 Transcript_5646/m.12548 type:complete len:135 (-) Transcript_5646:147-551(-)
MISMVDYNVPIKSVARIVPIKLHNNIIRGEDLDVCIFVWVMMHVENLSNTRVRVIAFRLFLPIDNLRGLPPPDTRLLAKTGDPPRARKEGVANGVAPLTNSPSERHLPNRNSQFDGLYRYWSKPDNNLYSQKWV